MKKTIVLGASTNPERYAYKAITQLRANGHPVVAIGKSAGQIEDVTIETQPGHYTDIDTISLYLSPANQVAFYDFILKQNPKRVIFNPGTENKELAHILDKKQINYENACTLVLLSLKKY